MTAPTPMRLCPVCNNEYINGYAKRCHRCSEIHNKAQAKLRSDTAYCLTHLVPVIGTTMLCEKCQQPMIKTSANRKYCDGCRDAAIKENMAERNRRRHERPSLAGDGVSMLANNGRNGHDLQTRIDRLVRAAQMPGYSKKHPERMIEMMEER